MCGFDQYTAFPAPLLAGGRAACYTGSMSAAAATDPRETLRRAGNTVRVDGLNLFYREVPGSQEAPLVLTHGIPRSSFVYRKVLDRLSGRRRAIAWDLFGAGFSDKPPERERYRFEEFERVFGLFLDALGVERAHLLCHDVGGPYTLGFAARHPERVASLTVLNTTLTLSGFRIPAPVAASALLPASWQRASLPDAAFTRFLYGYLRRRAHAASASLSSEDEAFDRFLLLRDGGRLGLIRTLQAYRSVLPYLAGVRRALAGFARPAAVLWGARDPFCRIRAGENIARLLGGCRMRTLPEASHYLQEDDPASVASEILRLAAEADG